MDDDDDGNDGDWICISQNQAIPSDNGANFSDNGPGFYDNGVIFLEMALSSSF